MYNNNSRATYKSDYYRSEAALTRNAEIKQNKIIIFQRKNSYNMKYNFIAILVGNRILTSIEIYSYNFIQYNCEYNINIQKYILYYILLV